MAGSVVHFCHTCEAADSALYEDHVMTKHHQIRAHRKENADFRIKHGIYVNNLPNLVPREEITAFFAAYGTIISSMVSDNNNYGIFEYEDEKVAAELIALRRVNFKQSVLNILARNPKPEKPYIKDDQPKENFSIALALLRSQQDINLEIIALHHYLQPGNKQAAYNQLCIDLKLVLSQYVQCVVYPFGSTVTGLDFTTSDVDAYVYISMNPNDRRYNKLSSEELAKRLVEIVPPYLTASQLFARIISIPNANTPIIKCVHTRTGIACDINFKNMLGVCNTYLIKKYLSYNRRLTIALIIIKFWGKVHSLTGVGKFNNYSLTIMYLYRFMQSPFNLPCTVELQKKHTRNIQGHWDAGINFGDYKPSAALNHLEIVELLYEFFNFYSSFNFADAVICPYIGRCVQRTAFAEGGTLPQEFDGYSRVTTLTKNPLRVNTSICVQDPFELCCNITRSVKPIEYEEFVEKCKEAARALSPEVNNPRLFQIFLDTNCAEDDGYFTMGESNKLKAYLIRQNNVISKDTGQLFQNFAKDFMTRLLTQVFLFDVKVHESPSKPPTKLKKMNDQNDIHDFHVVYDCAAYCNVWTSRTVIAKDFHKRPQETLFANEIRLSEYIANVVCKKIKTKDPVVRIQISLRPSKESHKQIKVALTNDAEDSFAYKELSLYFVKFVNTFYPKYVTSLVESTDQK